MTAGALNQRANLFVRTLTPDGGGGYGEAWEMVATVWARLEPVLVRSSADSLVAERLQSRPAYRVTVRRAGFYAAGQRLQIAGRTFWIRALEDRGAPAPYLVLYTEEIA